MRFQNCARSFLGVALATTFAATAMISLSGAQDRSTLALATGRVTIDGTSNVHAYTASTTAVHVTRVKLADAVAGPEFWDRLMQPGALEAFEVAVISAKLSSPKDGLDKNMHKALKVEQFPEITFRLTRLEARGTTPGTLRAIGMLKIAGVEREVALDITAQRKESGLGIKGAVQLLMTDYGITPPKAMLGMLKTDPKITVSFETVLTVPLT